MASVLAKNLVPREKEGRLGVESQAVEIEDKGFNPWLPAGEVYNRNMRPRIGASGER